MIQQITKPFKYFFRLEAASGLVLLFAAILALIISNGELSEYYFSTLEKYISDLSKQNSKLKEENKKINEEYKNLKSALPPGWKKQLKIKD